MKRKIFILSMLALSAGFVAFTAQKDSNDLTKVSVVHHEGNQVTVLDTVFDPATGYTVEQFLLDHGMNPDETDIINTDDLEGAHVHDLGHDVWFMDAKCSEGDVHMIKQRTVGKGERQFSSEDGEMREVRVEKIVDGEGNVTLRQFVNGEEVEPTEGEMFRIYSDEDGSHPQGNVMIIETEDQEGDGEMIIERRVFHADGDSDTSQEKLEEMIEKIKKEHGVTGDGDEKVIVVMDKTYSSEVNAIDLPEGAPKLEVEVEVEKTVNDDGEEQILMWINGEEVDPADHENLMNIEEGDGEFIIDIEMTDEDGENHWIVNGEDSHEIIIEMPGESGYTIAIVSSVSEGESVEIKNKVEKQELAISDLRFSPNPNGGQFNLSFTLPEKGRTELVIYDLQGKRVYEESLGKFTGEYNNQIDLSSAGPGTYILNIVQGKQKLAEKIIVR
ncbi:MAG: hypothetical protein ACI9RU_001605 [Litorivivens sp.]|jgi:hypothetical protein